jgi:fructose-specific component phosphotransferase system IIB-like protein
VDVRIGIVQSIKELEVELGEDVDREVIMGDIEEALQNPEGVLWLTDRKGRRVAVPVAKIAYVEVGAPVSERRVGFGAP